MTAVPFALGALLAPGAGRRDLDGARRGGLGRWPAWWSTPSPLTLETVLTYVQISASACRAASSGLELGNQIDPYPLPVLWYIYPLLLLLAGALPVVALLRRRRLFPRPWRPRPRPPSGSA